MMPQQYLSVSVFHMTHNTLSTHDVGVFVCV